MFEISAGAGLYKALNEYFEFLAEGNEQVPHAQRHREEYFHISNVSDRL
jgi:hypothetical protein